VKHDVASAIIKGFSFCYIR